MNNKNVLASIFASIVVMTALVAAGFIPAANNALAQLTNSSATNSTSSSAISTNATASIKLSPTSAQAGSTVSVTGTGFTSGSTVKLTLDSVPITTSPASITVTSSGTFSATFTVPSNVSSASAHSITATDSTQAATSVLTTITSTTSTATTASTASTPASVGSTTVQQGTVSSNNGNLTILTPRSDGAVFTGTISYASGASVELYVLHAYGTAGQSASSGMAGPKTMVGPDGKTYAISVITNVGSSAGDSGSTVFSGNGLMLHSTGGGSFIATYTLKATIDTPTIVNSLSPATTSSTTTSTTSANSTATTNTTSSTSINSTSSSSSSSAAITAIAGSSNDTITVSGRGFSPNSQVTTVVTLNSGTSGPTTSATTDSSGAFTLQMPLTSTVHGATVQIKTTSSGGAVAKTTYTVP